MYLANSGRCDKAVSFSGSLTFGVLLICTADNCLRLQKRHIVFFQNPGRYIRKLHGANDRIDIIVDQARAAFIHGHGPGILSVKRNVLFEKFLNGLALGNYKASQLLPVFDLGLRLFASSFVRKDSHFCFRLPSSVS